MDENAQPQIVIMYITASDAIEARNIARMLVEKRLAACVNISPNIQSVYWWEGQVSESNEASLLVKTTSAMVQSVVGAVKAVHSYKTPAIMVWPLAQVEKNYAQWLLEQLPTKP